jgi:hypothetical protein
MPKVANADLPRKQASDSPGGPAPLDGSRRDLGMKAASCAGFVAPVALPAYLC